MISKICAPLRQSLQLNFLITNKYRFCRSYNREFNPLIQNMNNLNSFKQFQNFYKQNQNKLNPNLYSEFLRRLGRFSQKQRLSFSQKTLLREQFLVVFAKSLKSQNLESFTLKELQGILYFGRIMKQIKNLPHQLFEFLISVINVVILRLQNEQFQLSTIVSLYYDISKLTSYCPPLTAKLHQIIVSKQQKYMKMRQKLQPTLMVLVLSPLNKKLFLNRFQKQIAFACCQILKQKASSESMNQIVNPFCILSQLSSQWYFTARQKSLLNDVKNLFIQNINKLSVKSIYFLLGIKSQITFYNLKQIYEIVIKNIFESIDQSGHTSLDIKIIFECLKLYSRKQKNIFYLNDSYFSKFKNLIGNVVLDKKQKGPEILNSQLPQIINNSYIKKQDLIFLSQFLTKNNSFNWTEKILSILSLRKVNLQQYYQKCQKKIINVDNTSEFVNLATSIFLQVQLNPDNLVLKSIKQKINTQSKKFKDIKGLEMLSQPVGKIFHNIYYKNYQNNIQKYPQDILNSIKVFQYYLRCTSTKDLFDYTKSIQITKLLRLLLQAIKKKININKFDLNLFNNILVLTSRYCSQIIKLPKLNQYKPLIELLTFYPLLIQLKPKNQYLNSYFFSIWNTICSNLQVLSTTAQRQIANSLKYYGQSSTCQQIRKSLHYYELITKFAKNSALFKVSPISQVINSQCIQLGIEFTPPKLKNQQFQFKKSNLFKEYIVNGQIPQQKMVQFLQLLKTKNLRYVHKLIKQLKVIPTSLIKFLQESINNTTYSSQLKIVYLIKALESKKSKPNPQLANLIQSLVKYTQNNVDRFFLYDHNLFTRFFIWNGVNPQKHFDHIHDTISNSYIPRYTSQKALKTLVYYNDELKMSDKLIKTIFSTLKQKDLQLILLIQSQKFGNVQQKLKMSLEKSKQQQSQCDNIVVKYIEILYPNLSQLTKQVKLAPSIAAQLAGSQLNLFNSLAKLKFIKFQKKQQKQVTYYTLNNLNLVLFKYQTNSKKIQNFRREALKKILSKDVITFQTYTSIKNIGESILQSINLSQSQKNQIAKIIQQLSKQQNDISEHPELQQSE